MSVKNFDDFKEYLRVKFPGLLEKFPNKDLGETFVNGAPRTKKPETMSAKNWDWFRQVEMDWMIENDLSGKENFIIVGNGVVSIKLTEVISKKEIDNDSTSIIIKEGDVQQVFDLVGNIDYINAKLNKQVVNG